MSLLRSGVAASACFSTSLVSVYRHSSAIFTCVLRRFTPFDGNVSATSICLVNLPEAARSQCAAGDTSRSAVGDVAGTTSVFIC